MQKLPGAPAWQKRRTPVRARRISFGIRAGTSLASAASQEGRWYDWDAQRTLLAETLRDIANIAAGAMVFGQFIGSQTFSVRIAAFGMGVWVALVAFAMVLAGERQP